MGIQQSCTDALQIRHLALALWALLLCAGLTASTTHAETLPDKASVQSVASSPDCTIAGGIFPSPNTAPNPNNLVDVEVLSATDVWAVGSYGSPARTLTMHWDGIRWSVVPSPNRDGATFHWLSGVDAVSSNDVWAVGIGTILHWDGTQWSLVPSPIYGLSAVKAISSNNVWAVGGGSRTITIHWDGAQWTRVPSPSPFPGNAGVEINTLSG